jgi:hypothetical protein
VICHRDSIGRSKKVCDWGCVGVRWEAHVELNLNVLVLSFFLLFFFVGGDFPTEILLVGAKGKRKEV